MVVLNTKDFDELQEETLEELEALGFSSNYGSIARLFLSIINSRIATAYTALTVNHLRAFLSTSDGIALDAIGSLLNCTRTENESDDSYKYRISQQCLVLASSNNTAVRLAALTAHADITNATIKPYAMGAGTFAVILTIDSTSTASESSVIKSVENAVESVVGYGIKFKVQTPTLTRVKLGFKIYINDTVSDTDAQSLKYDVKQAVSDYINNLSVGEDINVDQITQAIMNVSDDIISHQNTSFYIDNQKALYVNQSCRWFEKFALSNDVDNIIIT